MNLNNQNSKQNLIYWNRKPYLGFGPSACSFFKELRSVNLSDTRDYLLEINKFQKPLYIEYLSQKDIYNETIMTGLSISKGLSLLVIRKNFKSFDPYFQGKVKKHLGLGNLYLEKNSIYVFSIFSTIPPIILSIQFFYLQITSVFFLNFFYLIFFYIK